MYNKFVVEPLKINLLSHRAFPVSTFHYGSAEPIHDHDLLELTVFAVHCTTSFNGIRNYLAAFKIILILIGLCFWVSGIGVIGNTEVFFNFLSSRLVLYLFWTCYSLYHWYRPKQVRKTIIRQPKDITIVSSRLSLPNELISMCIKVVIH